jgi:transposase
VARRSTNYPRELRERAVRMVAQVRPEYPSDWPAIRAVAEKLGIGDRGEYSLARSPG